MMQVNSVDTKLICKYVLSGLQTLTYFFFSTLAFFFFFNQSTAQIDRFMEDTAMNIQHLKATQKYLHECIHNKQTGYDVDGSIKRLRQRRMHPRTNMNEIFQLVYT